MPGNAAFHPTIETVGFQTSFSVIEPLGFKFFSGVFNMGLSSYTYAS
jgi:hypothetical protein